jgi:hypothetical protein
MSTRKKSELMLTAFIVCLVLTLFIVFYSVLINVIITSWNIKTFNYVIRAFFYIFIFFASKSISTNKENYKSKSLKALLDLVKNRFIILFIEITFVLIGTGFFSLVILIYLFSSDFLIDNQHLLLCLYLVVLAGWFWGWIKSD